MSSAILKLDENGTVATGTYGGTSDGFARFRRVGDYKSLTYIGTDSSNAKDNFKGWDLIGPWDINLYDSADGDYSAFDFGDHVKMVAYGNNGTLRVYNSLNKNVTASGSFNKLTLQNDNAKLQFEVSTNLYGKELVFNANSTALHVVYGTLNYSVEKTTWNNIGAYIQVDAGATFKISDATAASGFTLSKATIEGDFVNETTKNLNFVKAAAPTEITGTLFTKGRIRLQNKATATFAGNVYYLKSTSPSMVMYGSNTLNLNSENTLYGLVASTKEEYEAADEEGKKAFVVRNEDDVYVYYKKEIASVVIAGDNSNVINVNATNEFYLNLSGIKTANVNVASDATWIVNGYISDAGATLNLNNFENDSLFILTDAKDNFDSLITTINAIAADGTTTYGKDDLVYVADIFNGQNGYWLQVAVPEPAEWAMIFGGLALGFAIYRRRR